MTLPLWILPVVIIIIYLFSSVKILREYERGVIFRLGRVLPQPKGPGIFLVFAPIDRMVRTSLRIEAMEVPAQDVITRDNVTVKVNAVVYFRVIDPTKAVIEVTNYLYAPPNSRRRACAAFWARWNWTHCLVSGKNSTSGCSPCSIKIQAHGASR